MYTRAKEILHFLNTDYENPNGVWTVYKFKLTQKLNFAGHLAGKSMCMLTNFKQPLMYVLCQKALNMLNRMSRGGTVEHKKC